MKFTSLCEIILLIIFYVLLIVTIKNTLNLTFAKQQAKNPFIRKSRMFLCKDKGFPN